MVEATPEAWSLGWLPFLVLVAILIALGLLTVLGGRGRRVLGLTAVFAVGLLVIGASLRYVATVSTRSVPMPDWPEPCQDYEGWKAMDALRPDAPQKTWVTQGAESEVRSKTVLGRLLCYRWPDPGGRLVGFSRDLEADLETAAESARASAEDGLKALVLARTDESRLISHQLDVADLMAGLDRLVQERTESLILDRFVQPLKRPYGTVYRSALLVTADRITINRLHQDLQKAIADGQLVREARRRELFWTAASALGLALVVFLLYALLNAGTKGYFAWPLRIVSVLALAVFYLGAMYWKGWIPG